MLNLFTVLPGNRYTELGLEFKVGLQVCLNWALTSMIREKLKVRQTTKGESLLQPTNSPLLVNMICKIIPKVPSMSIYLNQDNWS